MLVHVNRKCTLLIYLAACIMWVQLVNGKSVASCQYCSGQQDLGTSCNTGDTTGNTTGNLTGTSTKHNTAYKISEWTALCYKKQLGLKHKRYTQGLQYTDGHGRPDDLNYGKKYLHDQGPTVYTQAPSHL